MGSVQDRVAREREAHANRDVLAEAEKLQARFSHIGQYPSRVRMREQIQAFIAGCAGQRVLDYGCGRGDVAVAMLDAGARHVDAIDISEVYVGQLCERLHALGHAQDRWCAQVMDAHRLRFADDHFDLVHGSAILHHLDVPQAMSEIHRVLRPGGHAVFFEPLAGHPLLKLFRVMTPHARTVDERPFDESMLREIEAAHAWEVKSVYCGVLQAPVAAVTSFLMPRYPTGALAQALDRWEARLHAAGALRSWNQYVAFILQKR